MKKFLAIAFLLSPLIIVSQKVHCPDERAFYPYSMRMYDSVMASRIPVLRMPETYLKKSLPGSVDNSQYIYFPGILDQINYFTCQQFAGVSYTFAYEINRLRGLPGSAVENRYPAHYTWTFMNNGDQFTGVSFFYSFDVLKQQGHPVLSQYGNDTIMKTLGWMTGYDKYYLGMHNRLKNIFSIPSNTEEGIHTIKHYLNDHLDGSAEGGVVCFSASSNFTLLNFVPLPPGTPEEGKDIITGFYPTATHGMTIVGYNDSVRYDYNGDGKYTNNLDINGDGKVDVRDWEIGAFRISNSYGTWWSDNGFCWVMYRAMALNYSDGLSNWTPQSGIWNHSVYVVEPESDHQPLLTMKVNLSYNSRNKIRVKAGLSNDTLKTMPEHIAEFPIFSFQGGDHFMQGLDSIPSGKDMEFGLDLTPLLSQVTPGTPVRLFLILEEQDPEQFGEGKIHSLSFLDYTTPGYVKETVCPQSEIPVRDNELTILSVVKTIDFDKVQITTENLPVYQPGQPYSLQFQASGGKPPYEWTLLRSYEKKETGAAFPSVTQQPLHILNSDIPYAKTALPFSFPFYGQSFDTIYVNAYGFITFDPQQFPYPYVTDEEGMLKRIRCISPAFNGRYYIPSTDFMWIEKHPEWVCIRWRITDDNQQPGTYDNNFALNLYPDGEFEFIYGQISNINTRMITWSGYSNGDEQNHNTWTNWDFDDQKNKSYRFFPVSSPPGIEMAKDGNLTISLADSTLIYGIPVKVTDNNNISTVKEFLLSTGLIIRHELISQPDDKLTYGKPASFRLFLTNSTSQTLSGVDLTLQDSDSALTILDSTYHVDHINPGSTVMSDNVFSFSLEKITPDQYPVLFSIRASAGGHNWIKEFPVPVSACMLEITQPEIYDGYNNFLDVGEVADILIQARNSGSLDASGLEFILTTDDTLVTILSSPVLIFDELKAKSLLTVKYQVKASRHADPGHKAEFLLTVHDENYIAIQFPFTLAIGNIPVAILKLAGTTNSHVAMKTALDSLKVIYAEQNSIPADLSSYSCAFVILGTAQGSHILNDAESNGLAKYLVRGGKLYMEGYATWYYQDKTRLHPCFKYTTSHVPLYHYPQVIGIKDMLSDSMFFTYTSPINYAIFNIIPVAPAFSLFHNDDTLPKCLEFAYDGEDYKTIGTFLEFGALADAEKPSDKFTLMRRYLDFFDLNLDDPAALFHVSNNTICRWRSVDFFDDSFDNITSWQWEFPGGTPAASAEKNPSVSYGSTGKFDVKLTVSDGIHSKTIIKKAYITVNVCAGEKELSKKNRINIYPNPAYDRLYVDLSGTEVSDVRLTMYDLTGRILLQKEMRSGATAGPVELDLSRKSKGVFLLNILTNSFNETRIVILQQDPRQ